MMYFITVSYTHLSDAENIILRVESDKKYYRFAFSVDGKVFTELGTGLVVGLCTEGTKYMTFTGTYIGMFAENGIARFKNFKINVKDY